MLTIPKWVFLFNIVLPTLIINYISHLHMAYTPAIHMADSPLAHVPQDVTEISHLWDWRSVQKY